MIKRGLKLIILSLLTLVVIYFATSFGAAGLLDLKELFFTENIDLNLIYLRLPRILLSFIIGAGLALSGVVLQTFFRNDLCCPYTLGTSSFASLGAIFGIYLGFSENLIKLSAATAALLALLFLVFILFKRFLRDTSTVLLIGISIGLVSTSFIGLFQHLGGPEKLYSMAKWLEGGIEIISFKELILPFLALLFLVLCFFRKSRELDLIQVSFDFARGRGVEIEKTACWLIFPCAIFVGVITSLCGPIGFVGLIIPHFIKYFTGTSHRELLLYSLFLGGIFVIFMDLISRLLIAPAELPIGILSGLVGTPFFLALLFRRYFWQH